MRSCVECFQKRANGLDQFCDTGKQMIVSDLAPQMLPKAFDQIEPRGIGWQPEEQKLIRVLFKELLGLPTKMDDEIIDD